MQKKTIQFRCGTISSSSYLTWDDACPDPRPGVIVFPEAFGLNDHARNQADKLAARGYVALAVDFHGEGKVYGDMTTLGPVIQGLYQDRVEWRARVADAYQALLAQSQVDVSRTAAIGYCFGGACSMELARTGVDLGAVVTFHAGIAQELPEDIKKIKASVLICHGAEDGVVKKSVIDDVTEALQRDSIDWQAIYYGNAKHSFTNPAAKHYKAPGFGYNQRVDQRSWLAMCQLFDEIF